MERTTVLKVGGAELQEGEAFETLLGALVPLSRARRLVVVHGGGAEIADLQQRLGLAPCFVDGLRVTDGDSLRVAEMVLSGLVNKRLTAHLVARGVRALGLSGVDAGVLRARRLTHPKGDLGFVGEITDVDAACLAGLLDAGFTPVLSPISLGENGCAYNVNATTRLWPPSWMAWWMSCVPATAAWCWRRVATGSPAERWICCRNAWAAMSRWR